MDAVDRLDRLPLAGKRMTDPPESLVRRAAEQVIDIDEMLQRGGAPQQPTAGDIPRPE
jgi:hypothetical protein